MPLILGTNSIKDTSYDVANSLRFNSADSARLTRTQTSGDRNKATFSAWVKRSKLGANQGFFGIHGASSDAGQIEIRFQSSGEGFHISGYATNWRRTSASFRDVSAWYHLVVAFDTTLSTAGDRVKVYVNGVQTTAFAASENPDEDEDLPFGLNGATCSVGSDFNAGSAGNFFGGYLAEVVLIDGQQLEPTSFGEFDEDSPTIWKPKDVSGLTFGNNGFYLDFEDSSSLGNDAAGSNNFTATNLAATDQSTDTCTNNFATLNPLFPESNISYSEGNLKVSGDGSANWSSAIPTFGLTNGKWYWEWTATSSSNAFVGIVSESLIRSNSLITDSTPYDQNGLILYFTGGRKTVDGTDTESHFTAWSSGTMSCALDLDSGTRTIKMYHNGSQTGDTINLTGNFASGDAVFPVFMVNSGSNTSIINANFGSPSYANSSDAADGNGYGAFEYAPPSGYYAINTKNLAEHG